MVAAGVTDLDTKIKDARATDPDETINVLALSQGSVVATYEINKLRDEGYDTSNIVFVLTGDPNRPNGGALARIPVEVTVPIFGLTVGQEDVATPSDGARVVVVTNQFDWAADDPAYLFNVVAWANIAAGFFYKTHNYENTAMNDPTAIVTTSGNMTSIFIPNPEGNLPLTAPLKGIVPQEYITAMDPFLRAVIMTGYAPSDEPAKRVTLRLAPPVSEWPAMAESVKDGLDETVRRVKPLVLEDISVDPSIHTNGSDEVSTSFVQYGAKFPKPQTDTLTESVQWKPESLSQFQLPVNSPSGDKGKLLDVVTVGKPEGDVTRTKPALIGDGNKFTPPHITGNVSASQERKPGDALSSALNQCTSCRHPLPTLYPAACQELARTARHPKVRRQIPLTTMELTRYARHLHREATRSALGTCRWPNCGLPRGDVGAYLAMWPTASGCPRFKVLTRPLMGSPRTG